MRDALYGAPPAHLPDTPETRDDMACFKASARSLDQGVGAVLHALDEAGPGRRHARRAHHRPRAPVPRGEGDAVSDRGLGVMLIVRGPGGFLRRPRHRRAGVARRPLPDPARDRRRAAPARDARQLSLLPLVRKEADAGPRRAVRRAHLPRRLRPAARDPHAPPQAHPPLRRPPRAGAAQRRRLPLQGAARSPPAGASSRGPASSSTTWSWTRARCATSPRTRCTRGFARTSTRAWRPGWRETADPLLDGPVPAPPGRGRQRPGGRVGERAVPRAPSTDAPHGPRRSRTWRTGATGASATASAPATSAAARSGSRSP